MDRTSRWYAMNLGIVALALVLLAPHVAVEVQSAARVSRIGFLRFGPPPQRGSMRFGTAAKALGLTMPQSLLPRADAVIQ
jgi:hypothetical protein